MNKELLNVMYDHRDICRMVEQYNTEGAVKLWEERAALMKDESESDRCAMLEALSQSIYDHILQVRGCAPAEYRHESRMLYQNLLPQQAMVAHGKQIIQQYIQRMNAEEEQNDHISMACCYISTHLSEQLTLETVAKNVYVSKCYLCRIFRSRLGQSFSQYITQQRLERAEHLLQHSNLSIDRIAEQCGFGSAAYFATLFRRRNGVSPSSYRRTMQTKAA